MLNGTNNAADVFIRDLLAGSTTRASLTTSGGQANGSLYPAPSGDGGLLAFQSDASNLAPGDTNRRTDVFVRLR